MSGKLFVIVIFLSFLVVNNINSQPKATFQLIGSYSFPMQDYKGIFGNTYESFTFGGNPDSLSYFMKHGANYGLTGKFPINRKYLPINITGSLLISSFGQKKQYTNDTVPGYREVNLAQNITTIGFGLEYSPAGRKAKLVPYIGIEFVINLFSGNFTDYQSVSGTTVTYTLVSTVRGGIQARAGADFVLHNNVGLTVGAVYSLANLIGKHSNKDVTPNYYLNDAAHNDQSTVYPDRTIAYLQLFGGVSFYFGR